MNEHSDIREEDNSLVDALSAIVLIVVFVSACVFWVSSR